LWSSPESCVGYLRLLTAGFDAAAVPFALLGGFSIAHDGDAARPELIAWERDVDDIVFSIEIRFVVPCFRG